MSSNFGNTTFARDETARRHARWLAQRATDEEVENSFKAFRERREAERVKRGLVSGRIIGDAAQK